MHVPAPRSAHSARCARLLAQAATAVSGPIRRKFYLPRAQSCACPHHGMHRACLMYLLAQATTAVSGPVRRFSLYLCYV